jgi:hypothetical protein
MNPDFELFRVELNETEIIGVLFFRQKIMCCTLEPPWRGNRVNQSCIPTGIYSVSRFTSPSRGECLKVQAVPGRSDILIHVGNTISDTSGCILVGHYPWQLEGNRAVLNSSSALSCIFTMLPAEEDTWSLAISNMYVGSVFSEMIAWR